MPNRSQEAPSETERLHHKLDKNGKRFAFFENKKRYDDVVCETDLVPESDEKALFEGGDRLKILIASTNVGNAPIKEMDSWVPLGAPHTDIVVFGLQESTYGSAEIDTGNFGTTEEDNTDVDGLSQVEIEKGDKHLLMMLQKQVGPEFVLLEDKARGQMRLRIFVRAELEDGVLDVETGAENTGIGHVLANKGGQAIKFMLRGTTLVFVSSHLAAHEGAEKCMRRNGDVAEIFHGIRFGNKKYDITQFDHIFWNGDLNYRIEVTPEDMEKAENAKFQDNRALVMSLVESENYATLWEMDELQREMKNGRVFSNFRTARADFRPTFKVQRKDGGTDGKKTEYNPKRIPSYCDRIVWQSARHLKAAVECHSYVACHRFATSDHKPILGRFSVLPTPPLQVINQPTFIRTLDESNSVSPNTSAALSTGDEVDSFSHYPQLRFFDLSAEGLYALDVGVRIQKKKKNEKAAKSNADSSSVETAAADTTEAGEHAASSFISPGWVVGMAQSDPYALFETQPPELLAARQPVKTEVVFQTLEPAWKVTPVVSLRAKDYEGVSKGSIVVHLFDYDSVGKHDIIGQVKFSLQEIIEGAAAALNGDGIFAFERDVVCFGIVHGVLRGKVEVNVPTPDGKFPFAKRCIEDPALKAPAPRSGCGCAVS